PWWVRLPFSSATLQGCTVTPAMSFLDALKAAADQAEAIEAQGRREAARRVAALEQERAFAFRRLNLMRAIAGALTGAETEESATANAAAVLRAKLGWSSDSEARSEVLARFVPVAQAVFREMTVSEDPPPVSVPDALSAFETWYARTRPEPFWILF